MTREPNHYEQELDATIMAARAYFQQREREGFDSPPSAEALALAAEDPRLTQALAEEQRNREPGGFYGGGEER